MIRKIIIKRLQEVGEKSIAIDIYHTGKASIQSYHKERYMIYLCDILQWISESIQSFRKIQHEACHKKQYLFIDWPASALLIEVIKPVI